jgi:glucose dehydrogenase
MRRLSVWLPAAVLALNAVTAAQNARTDWPNVGGDPGGSKYSPVDQITPANVAQLKEAWSYQPGGPFPIVVGTTMYVVSGGNAVALNADTGQEIWKFALREATPGFSVRRGMTYWPGDATHAPRVLVTITSGRLVQLDARTGQLVPDVTGS